MTLFLLNLRLFLGWWRHPVELRATSKLYLKALPVLTAFLIIFLAIMPILIILARLPPADWRLSPALLNWALRLAVGAGMVFGPLILGPFLLVGATSWLFARRGERGGESTVYGRCFTVLLDPPFQLFARIGLTRETARWYGLPLDWDMVVEPSEAEFELRALAGTGWVERLRRLGPASRVLTQPVPELSERGVVAAPQAEDEEEDKEPEGNDDISNDEREDEPEGATAEEKQTLRRFARRADLGWRASPAKIASMGWACVVSALLLFPGIPAYVALLVRFVYPLNLHETNDPASRIAVIVSLGVLFILCIIFVAMGLHYLRAWRRVRRFRHESPVSVTGEVTCWIQYRDAWSPNDWHKRKETLISLRLPDGQTHLFRIPIRYLHRVRKRGAHVRITYLPTTERVQDVGYVEMPTQAPVEASSQGT